MGAAGKYVEANAAAAALFGVGRRRISGKPAGSFTRHEASEEFGRRLFATLAESGALHSTAVVKRPDGEEWSIEFHMPAAGWLRRRDAPDPGGALSHLLVAVRTVQPTSPMLRRRAPPAVPGRR